MTAAMAEMKKNNSRIMFVLPHYTLDTDTHYNYIYQLLPILADRFDIKLVIERGQRPHIGNFVSVAMLPSKGSFLEIRRIGAMIMHSLAARFAGCRLVYTHYSFYGGIFASLVFRFTGGRSLYWSCGVMSQFWVHWSIRPANLVKKAREELLLRLILKLISGLVTGTTSMAHQYSHDFGIAMEKINIVPNWINLSKFHADKKGPDTIRNKLDIRADAPVLLFVHRIVKRKGSDRLLDIMKHILTNCESTVLIIVGSGPDEKDLKNSIESSNLGSQIKMIGAVPNAQLLPYFSAANVFLMPSREEGFPHVLLEAMATGLPFVAVEIGGVKDITTPLQRQFLVNPFSCVDFANKVTTILKDKSLAARLCDDGLQNVRKFSIEKAADSFTKLWNKYIE